MMVASHALCGYDIHSVGSRARLPIAKRRPPCRRVARWVLRSWIDPDGADLYLCASHAAAFVRLKNADDDDDFDLEPVDG